MGTNRRYADSISRQIDERILERHIVDAGPLQTLRPEELELDRRPLTIDPQPKPCRAWVRFGATPARVEARVHRWTDRAVGIEFVVAEQTYRCWLWASAVEPIE